MAYLSTNNFYSSFAKKGKTTSGSARTAQGIVTPTSASALPKPPAPAPALAPSAPSTSTGAPAGFTVSQGSLPPDPVYQAAIGALQGTKDTTLAGLAQQRTAGLQQYGYTEDPTTHAIAFDPNNPYSQAALMRKHAQQAKKIDSVSYANAGHLYGGGLQSEQNANTDRFNQSDNALTNAVINFLARNTIEQNAASDAFNTGAAGALGTSVQNAPSNPLYSAAAGAGGALVSGDANGNMALTAANGPAALVPQDPYSSVKLASGFSIVYGPDGKPLYMLDPNGNRVGG